MKIAFKHPKTGELKLVKVGWSWTLFFFTGFLGLPLFLRRLNIWGGIILVLWAISTLASILMPETLASTGINLIFSIMMIVFSFWFAIKGNEMTAKNYLEHDWAFAEPDSEITKVAKMKWGVSV